MRQHAGAQNESSAPLTASLVATASHGLVTLNPDERANRGTLGQPICA